MEALSRRHEGHFTYEPGLSLLLTSFSGFDSKVIIIVGR